MTIAATDHLVLDAAAQDLLFREAHTAHAFTDEPVSDEQIEAVYNLVKFAPTAMNQSPLRVVLVRTPEAKERLVGHMSDGNKAKTAAAPLTAILAVDNEFHEHLPRLFPAYPTAKEMFAGNEELRLGNAQLNGALQAAYFIIGIRAAGLAAGPMAGYNAETLTKDFFGEGKHSVLAVVNIGKPGEGAFFPRGERLAYDEVVTSV